MTLLGGRNHNKNTDQERVVSHLGKIDCPALIAGSIRVPSSHRGELDVAVVLAGRREEDNDW